MSVYFITGNLGGGKSLIAVSRIRDYLLAGKPVATNIDLDLAKLVGDRAPGHLVYRLPDFPDVEHFEALGEIANDDDEERNGAIVLDEGAMYLNARDWNAKGREALLRWFLHSRKLGWDLFFLVQSFEMIDKQIRQALGEYIVYLRRWDRMMIPGVGRLLRLLTFGRYSGRLPRLHTAVVNYGSGPNAMNADTWHIRGTDIFGAYRTKQRFSAHYPHGLFCMLPGASLIPAKAAKPTGDAATRAAGAASPVAKPDKLRIVRLLMEYLGPDERIKHWQRLERLGMLR